MQILHSSVQVLLLLTAISISSSETAADFVNLVSLSTAVTLPINPHFDLCSKEITLVGSWVYTLRDYATTFDFLKRAIAIGLPIKELITHRFPLEEMNEALETNLAQKGLKIAYVRKDLI